MQLLLTHRSFVGAEAGARWAGCLLSLAQSVPVWRVDPLGTTVVSSCTTTALCSIQHLMLSDHAGPAAKNANGQAVYMQQPS